MQRLKVERDIYEKAAELIKKDHDINLQTLTNREKAIIINALQEAHPLNVILKIIHMSKSSYSYQLIASKTDKYTDLRTDLKDAFKESYNRYGYHRIHSVIKSAGTTVLYKFIGRIMKEEDLVVLNI